jgi:hypothetical protein
VRVDRDDVKRYLDFVNDAICDLLISGRNTAEANTNPSYRPTRASWGTLPPGGFAGRALGAMAGVQFRSGPSPASPIRAGVNLILAGIEAGAVIASRHPKLDAQPEEAERALPIPGCARHGRL